MADLFFRSLNQLADCLLFLGNVRSELWKVLGVTTLFVFAKAENVGLVLWTPTVKVKVVFLTD